MANETVKPEKEKKPFNKKKLKYGAAATVITVVFIAVVVVLNLIAGVITERKDVKLDLTKEKYYEVSQETIDYVKNIKKDVEIAVMAKESAFTTSGNYRKMVLETIDKYKQYSDHITVNFYDVVSNPDVVTKFSANYNGEITDGDIVISSGDRVKVLKLTSLFTIQQDYYGNSSITSYKGEQELTSAIMNVTDANPKRVAFISKLNGSTIYHQYNTNSIDNLFTLLEKNGYVVTEVDMMSDELSPEDYDMAVLPAPVNDLSDDGIKKLEDFLYNNGSLDKNMIYIADAIQFATPKLDEFLEVWGIEVGGSIVCDASEDRIQYVMTTRGPVNAPIVSISDETFSEGLSNTKLPVVFPYSRPVELLFDSNVDRSTSSLLTTSDTSYLDPLEMQTIEEVQAQAEAQENGEETAPTEEATAADPETAEKAKHPVMAIASKTSAEGDKVHTNNVMVIGGATILDPYILSSSNNAEFVVNAVNKMCGKENGVIIAEKDLSVQTINVKASQMRAINRTVVFIIPLAVVAAGVIVFLRRRNR